MSKFDADKLKLRHIEIAANPPIIKPKERPIKEKLYFWWADVKFSMAKVKALAIDALQAYIATIIIFVLSYITVRYLRQVLPF